MIVSLFPTPLLFSEFDVKPELLQWVKKHHEHSMYHEGNSSSAGWHSEYNLHEQQSFLEHSLLIYAHVAHAMKSVASQAPTEISQRQYSFPNVCRLPFLCRCYGDRLQDGQRRQTRVLHLGF